MSLPRLSSDVRRILWAQALRAFAYGFGAVLLGSTLDREGFSSGEVGLVLTAVVAGTVISSLAVGRWGDRWGRRRSCSSGWLLLRTHWPANGGRIIPPLPPGPRASTR